MQPRSPLRLIDANLNRAKEAVRTLEDICRFLLDDAVAAAELKSIRHEITLAATLAGWDAMLLALHRDTPGDLGTALTTQSETQRGSMHGVAVAAASRATEALRVLEEVAKLESTPSAFRPTAPSDRSAQSSTEGSVSVSQIIEKLRYRLYAAAGKVTARLGGTSAPQWALCVLITASACAQHGWERVAELACEGGADCLQLREKDLPDRVLLERAKRLREITNAHGVSCVINDRPDIALMVSADGVHVGQDDLPVQMVRRLSGSRLLIGVSTANLDQAREAVLNGADLCGLGPMFPSGTKPKESLAGTEYLRAYLEEPALARVPHLAISGITPVRAGELRQIGCRGVAVCAQVCSADDPRAAARELLEIIKPARGTTPER